MTLQQSTAPQTSTSNIVYDPRPIEMKEKPKPAPIKEDNKKFKIIMAVVIIVLVVSAILGYYFYRLEKSNMVRFQDTEVKFINSQGGGGELADYIRIIGYVNNTGSEDIPHDKIVLRCQEQFLQENFEKTLTKIVDEPSDETLKKKERVKFMADLGYLAYETYSTTGDFVLLYDGVENDKIPLDVSNQYK